MHPTLKVADLFVARQIWRLAKVFTAANFWVNQAHIRLCDRRAEQAQDTDTKLYWKIRHVRMLLRSFEINGNLERLDREIQASKEWRA